MGSSFGRLFRVTTFGESHGGALGAIVEGCPPGLELDLDAVQAELDRRRPGQSSISTQRKEPDQIQVLSGLFEGRTLGTSLALVVHNKDADPSAYASFAELYRPSHADYTYEAKYGLRNWQGGGRASARETVARVAAGAVAKQLLAGFGVSILGWTSAIGDLAYEGEPETLEQVEANPVRCPDPVLAEAMEARIRQVRAEGDTLGGVVRCVARGVPAGLGAPVFDKLEADLAKAMLSLPACKGFESGSGYAGTRMLGSEHNDLFEPGPDGIRTRTNRSGGVQGGISNGMPVTLSAAFKPVATIFREQDTVDRAGRAATIKPRGRHDPCPVPRAVPVVEAMVALVLVDHLLRQRAQRG
jgi:chorismate synthase